MKKLLVLALSALLVLGLATVSMAAATFSGEIQVGIKGATVAGDANSWDWAKGKMVMNGKLGDDLTGTLVFLRDGIDAASVVVDEASLTFTEDFGTFKLGYYGWNNNVDDILGNLTPDVKSETNLSTKFALTDNVSLGLAYGFTGSSSFGGYSNPYGVDLGVAGDSYGLDLLYFNYGTVGSDLDTAWGVNAWMKLDAFKPYIQYRNQTWGTVVSDFIVGATFEPANAPIYARAEVNLSGDFSYAPWGIRFGYKLENGAKVETQYAVTASTDNTYYVKVVAPF